MTPESAAFLNKAREYLEKAEGMPARYSAKKK